jgi:hypothetical protein
MPIDELTSLTSKERILLYLSDYVHMEDRFELPADLTQEFIAFGTGIQRKHLSQYLRDLLQENLRRRDTGGPRIFGRGWRTVSSQ